MSKGGGGTPASPDPYQTAAAQTQQNVTTAQTLAELNRVNQFTPFGSTTYSQNPSTFDQAGYDKAVADYEKNKYTTTPGSFMMGPNSTSIWTQATQKLNPNAVAPDRNKFMTDSNTWNQTYNLDPKFQGVVDQAANAISSPLDFNNLPAAPQYDAAERQRLAEQMLTRMEPKFQQDEDAMRTRLLNQGIRSGSEAWGREMDNLGESRNDARIQADIAAGDEVARMFGLGSSARSQALNEQLIGRQTPINEIAALMSGSQLQQPAQTSLNPTDLQGNIYANYQGQQDAYNQRVAQKNATTGAAAGLGSSALLAYALMASDERLKENIYRVGQTDSGLPVYIFNYIGDPKKHMGVMAQEVMEEFPDAVHEIDGILFVDYGRIQ